MTFNGNKIPVRFKRIHKDAGMPTYANPGDVGADVKAVSVSRSGFLFPLYIYRTGLVFELPSDYWIMLTARSSISKLLLWLANGVGVIDAGFRGEIEFRFRGFLGFKPYKVGDRIGQIVLMKRYEAEFEEADQLSDSQRGDKGFGSTGK